MTEDRTSPCLAPQAGVLEALLRSGLVLDVLAKDLNRRAASRDEAVARRPEHRLAGL